MPVSMMMWTATKRVAIPIAMMSGANCLSRPVRAFNFTGASLRANNLRVVETVLESTTQLIANRAAWADKAKRRKIEDLRMLLDGAINALDMVGLMLNVHGDNLAQVLATLPALHNPTVSSLSDQGWHAVNTILKESTVREIIPRLKEAGAEGIVEYPLNKIVL